MMREDDSFDELIREKLKQRSFKPSSQRRSKIQKAIDSRNMLKRFRMGMNIGITIVAASGIIFFSNYLLHRNSTAEKSQSEISKTNNQNVLNSPTTTTPSQDQSFDSKQNDSQKSTGTNVNSSNQNDVNNSASGNQVVGNDNHSSNNTNAQNSNSSTPHSNNNFAQNSAQNNSNKQNKNSDNQNPISANNFSKNQNQNNTNLGQTADGNGPQNKNSNSSDASASGIQNANDANSQPTNSNNGMNPSSTASTGIQNASDANSQTSSSNNGMNPASTASTGIQNANDANSQTSSSNNGMNPASTASTGIQNTNDANSQTSSSNNGINPSSTASTGIQNTSSANSQTSNPQNEQVGNKINSSPTAAAQKDSAENQIAKNNLSSSQTNTAKSNTVVQSQVVDSNKIASSVKSPSSDTTGIIPADQNRNGRRHSGNVNYFFAETGFTFIPGFAAGYHSGRSLNPVVGGGWNFRIKMKSSMEIGLHYTFIGHASDSSIIYTNTTYGFGAQYQYTEVGLKRLHYAALPVSFIYHVNGKHAIAAGVTANYLFTTETRWRTYSQVDSNIHSISKFGYGQGINRFDLLLTAGYNFTFNQAWSMRLSGYCGLMDIKKNSWYGVNKFERNKGIQFTIQYAF